MPRISAPTVKDHRAMIKARLIAAAEKILREDGPEHLTAGLVAAQAGIARNSIYRYVDSVEDLKILVLEQYVPAWGREIFPSEEHETPEERIEAFLLASLDHSTHSSHGWLMSLMRDSGVRNSARRARAKGDVENIHAMVDNYLIDQWRELGVERPRIWASYTRLVLFESFKEIEKGIDPVIVKTMLISAVRGLIQGSRECCDTREESSQS